jgi:hypothetical protein
LYSVETRLFSTFLILTAILLLHHGKANAAGGKDQRPHCDYVEYQRLPLTKMLHGIDGALVIMRDRSILAVEQYSLDDHDTSCNARLYLVGRNNKRIATHKMERPIARIDTVNLIGGRPDSFALTVDYSAGFGSYSGPATQFFDVVAGKIQWIHAKDEKTRKTQDIRVAKTLKTEWKLLPYGQNKDILEILCRPAFKNKNDNTFEVTYERYRFNGRDWIHYSRSVDGFWENEGDFPNESLFPPVNPEPH